MGRKVPRPPLLSRGRVEEIAQGFDATVKWERPSFVEKMAVTVSGAKQVQAVWLATGTHPAGHRVVLYLDPTTGQIWQVEELGKRAP